MNYTIKLDDTNKQHLEAYCKTEIEKIENEKKEALRVFDEKLKPLQDLLNQLSNPKSLNTLIPTPAIRPNTREPYNNDWSWAWKAEYVLGKIGRPSSTREILQYIYKVEPTIMLTGSDRDLHTKLSSTLIQKTKEEMADKTQFSRVKSDIDGAILYGLKIWEKK